MSYWTPGAAHRPVCNYTNRARPRTDGVVLHVTAAPGATSQFGWFNNRNSGVSAHFHVAADGRLEQYIDADLIAWAQRGGDQRLLSIETQGGANGRWTPEQASTLARLIRDLAEHYDFPISLMGSSRTSERGIGYHALGVPATRSQLNAGISQTGGELWSSAVGKVCPGPERIAQIPEIIAAAAGCTQQPLKAAQIQGTENEMTPEQAQQLAEAHWLIGNSLAPAAGRTEQRTEEIINTTRAMSAQIAALSASVKALSEAKGLDSAQVAKSIDAAVSEALKDLKVTLTTTPEGE